MLYFSARLAKERSYRARFSERLGILPSRLRPTNPGAIWLHAVSVGEVTSAVPLIEKLHSEQPSVPIYVSTSTVAGRKAAERHFASKITGIFFLPLDYVSCVRRTLRKVRPALLIVMETEIWPNLYSEIKRAGASLAIVNGRISDRSWPRYLAARHFFAPVLSLADLILAQSEIDKNRYLQLGVHPDRLATRGNLKYDAASMIGAGDFPTFGASQIWIAASTAGPNERDNKTHPTVDEDDLVIEVFRALGKEFPGLLLILAPRQPSRFDIVAEKLRLGGISYVRRSKLKQDYSMELPLPGVLLLDTIGELSQAFPLAHAAFVGGSIAPRGGHNFLEPAAAQLPIVVGPHTHNFAALMRDFLDANAIIQIEGGDALAPAIRDLLMYREKAAELGRRAFHVIEQNRGVSARVAAQLWPLYWESTPKPSRHRALQTCLVPLGFLWKQGGVLKRHLAERRAESLKPLPVPVISVGGITVGGSGKTPFVEYLAKRLQQQGHRPAILTRGYRRRSPGLLVLAPGSNVSPAFTGDEAQIFLRSAAAAVGIGSNRYQTATMLLQEHSDTSVFLLDDGFQHAGLARDLDIVVIDGLDPFGQDNVVPLGRLREPLIALQRADVFVVTRAENNLRYEAICRRLRDYNPSAPVFRTRLVVRGWREYGTGATHANLNARRLGAFCGLGNPQNFWNTLQSLNLEVTFRQAFRDHHSYNTADLQRIARHALANGAEILVTTEKDRLNCPDHLESVIAPLKLFWLEIGLELEEESRFFAMINNTLSKKMKSSLLAAAANRPAR